MPQYLPKSASPQYSSTLVFSSLTLTLIARLALVLRQKKHLAAFLKAKAEGKKPEMPTRIYNRCKLCDRRHGYMRFFGICRICFRELASNGEVPGVTKSSW